MKKNASKTKTSTLCDIVMGVLVTTSMALICIITFALMISKEWIQESRIGVCALAVLLCLPLCDGAGSVLFGYLGF